MLTDRTLMGHESAKNQQLEDHYFGAIPARVHAFMRELEFEAYRYGIPIKTRHNEVAPNQFEFAPIYGETNLAVDQNLIVMSLMHKIANKQRCQPAAGNHRLLFHRGWPWLHVFFLHIFEHDKRTARCIDQGRYFGFSFFHQVICIIS